MADIGTEIQFAITGAADQALFDQLLSSFPSQKVFHSHPHTMEKPISDIYSVIDNNPARNNLENDFPN